MKKLLGGFSPVIGLLLGVLLLSMVYFLGMSLAKTYLPPPYKCWVMTCELASWKEIQQVVLTNVREHEVISDVGAFPETDFKSPELKQVRIHITYTDNLQPTTGVKHYRQRVLVFDDRMLLARNLDMMTFSMEQSGIEFQTQFFATKLGPREAYRIVWDQLQRSPHLKNVLSLIIGLGFGKETSESSEKLVWSFHFLMRKGTLIYDVDAETGKIIYETAALRP